MQHEFVIYSLVFGSFPNVNMHKESFDICICAVMSSLASSLHEEAFLNLHLMYYTSLVCCNIMHFLMYKCIHVECSLLQTYKEKILICQHIKKHILHGE